jgi:hypothetical protein
MFSCMNYLDHFTKNILAMLGLTCLGEPQQTKLDSYSFSSISACLSVRPRSTHATRSFSGITYFIIYAHGVSIGYSDYFLLFSRLGQIEKYFR